jgi:hypothetical protein
MAEAISDELGSDLDEILDGNDRSGTLRGWFQSGKDATKGNLTTIEHGRDPTDYDLVVIGTPVWAWTMTPAIRTYLAVHTLPEVAFFCTYGIHSGRAFQEMEEATRPPLSRLGLCGRKVDSDDARREIRGFCEGLLAKPRDQALSIGSNEIGSPA